MSKLTETKKEPTFFCCILGPIDDKHTRIRFQFPEKVSYVPFLEMIVSQEVSEGASEVI